MEGEDSLGFIEVGIFEGERRSGLDVVMRNKEDIYFIFGR